MRLGEIIILISLTLSTIVVFIPQRNRPFVFTLFSFTLPVIILLHIIVEQPRWQMVPAYVFAGIIILIIITQSAKRKREVKIFFPQKKKNPHPLLIIITGILLFAIFLLPMVFPVFSLPLPSGPYTVGTVEYTIHDESRPESITENPDDYRKFVIKIWYPGDPAGNEKKDPYWSDSTVLSQYIADEYRIPSFFFKHLDLVKTNSFIQPPVSPQQPRYPLVLSLHGGSCVDSVRDLRILNEDLASQGFIVIGLTHPYSSSPVIFADGQTATCPDDRRKNLNIQSHLTQTLWDSYITQQPSENTEILQNIFDMEPMTLSEIKIRTGDVQSVISWLDSLDKGDVSTLINGKFDMSRINIYGLRLGGSVALNAILRESRINACVNIDGFHYTGTGTIEITKPYMLFTSEESRLHTLPFIKNQFGSFSFLITLKGAERKSFTDFSLFSPLIDLFHSKGTLSSKSVITLSREYIYTFFSTFNIADVKNDTKKFLSIENLNRIYKEKIITSIK